MNNVAHDYLVIIPTSPIPSNPSTSIIEQTIKSVRHHLPDAPILIQADGVRPEQEKFRESYEKYLSTLSEKIAKMELGDTALLRFPEFSHQARMMKLSLANDIIRTSLVFYVEHDLPLLPDFIDFPGIFKTLLDGEVNLIRLHYWSQILDDHKYLMLDKTPMISKAGVPLVRTTQYSQHPHIATRAFYEALLANYSEDCRTMIETRAYGLVATAPWEEWKCAIYAPEPNLKRVWHTHGREEEPKWEEQFTF